MQCFVVRYSSSNCFLQTTAVVILCVNKMSQVITSHDSCSAVCCSACCVNSCIVQVQTCHGQERRMCENDFLSLTSSFYLAPPSSAFPSLTLLLFSTLLFTRESSYCFQRVLAIAIPSVHLSVTRVDQAKMVQARISKSSPSAAWRTLVSETVKLFLKFEGGHPERGP